MKSLRKFKLRPKEMPQIGDKVVLFHRGCSYEPAHLVNLVRKNRNKIQATIEFRQITVPPMFVQRHGNFYKKKCNFIDLVKTREDYWWESLGDKFISKLKKDPWATLKKK
jgi:hypothetical protein